MDERAINWPTSHLPHSRTIRARVFRNYILVAAWLIALPTVVSSLAVYHLVALYAQPDTVTLPSDPTFTFFSRFLWWCVLVVGLAIGLPAIGLLRHLRTVLDSVFGAGRTERWRKEWERFEREAERATASITQSMTGAALVQLLEQAPIMPLRRRIELDEYKDVVVTSELESRIPSKPDAAPPLLGYVLSQFALWKRRHATGFSNGTISHVHMLDRTTQYWAFVSADSSGPLIALRIQTGILWWTEPQTLSDGTRYEGDLCLMERTFGAPVSRLGVALFPFMAAFLAVRTLVVGLGRVSLPLLVFGVLAVSLFTCFWGSCLGGALLHPVNTVGYPLRPILVLVFTVPIAIAVLYKLGLDRDTSLGKPFTQWNPVDGDASDLLGLSVERRKAGGFGVILSENQKAALSEARQQTMLMCDKAVDRLQNVRNR